MQMEKKSCHVSHGVSDSRDSFFEHVKRECKCEATKYKIVRRKPVMLKCLLHFQFHSFILLSSSIKWMLPFFCPRVFIWTALLASMSSSAFRLTSYTQLSTHRSIRSVFVCCVSSGKTGMARRFQFCSPFLFTLGGWKKFSSVAWV